MTFNIPENHFYLSAAQSIDTILTPLKKFGIHLFTYLRNYHDGSQIYLCSNPYWTLDYYNKMLYKSSLFEQHPVVYRDGFISWPVAQKDLPVFKHGQECYESLDGITYTEKQDNYREFFFFSCKMENYMPTFVANHTEILQRFILYFKAEAEALLKKAEKHTILLPNHFNNSTSIIHNVESSACYQVQLKKEFFEQTSIQKYRIQKGQLKGVKLSTQELECVAQLLDYKSIKEISESMAISARTVETYLNNIKYKLNCDSKNDIIKVILQHGLHRDLLIVE